MPNAFVQPSQPGEYVASEARGGESRSTATVTVTGGVALPSGTVLGKVTATGKLVRYAASNSDGSQTAVAVLYTPCSAVNGDRRCVVHDRDCEVAADALSGLDAAAVVSLKVVGVIVRGAPTAGGGGESFAFVEAGYVEPGYVT